MLTHIGVWVKKTEINMLYPRCKFNIYYSAVVVVVVVVAVAVVGVMLLLLLLKSILHSSFKHRLISV